MVEKQENLDENKKWMATGAIGCTFAAFFAKHPKLIGWETVQITNPFAKIFQKDGMIQILSNIKRYTSILSLQFPKSWNQAMVREWALVNGFYEEVVAEGLIGLRWKGEHGVSWVQYFGPDAHVKTRQAPIPELCFTIKLPPRFYFKVGWNGILHLAHASIEGIKESIADKLWETSFKNTKRKLGHSPTLEEAAKVTFKK